MAVSSPEADYKQETRFAVVMYGGVSLAIYINGIAQELFHLVSSTARETAGAKTALPADALTPTQRVYRKLSYILSNREFRTLCKDQAEQQKDSFKVPDTPADATIETRFVIDILSGTSAGGINAIFLAKALANNQNIDQLKELWVNEGDIGVLLNDKRSVGGLGLMNQRPPLSLLNSRRMYLKLLKAFDDMEKVKRIDGDSRFLDESELDLFITTTDIAGLPLPIRLSDSVVFERRHRNVFQFKYVPTEPGDKAGENPATDAKGATAGRNDFTANNNPFLAFAARCTSSFPFAFEPMKLSDIDEVLDTFPEHRGNANLRGTKANWERFFSRNVRSSGVNIEDRPFGDGGYLDNKPFSFAVDTIARRQAALPVDRKLIYIEPSPEHPEDEGVGNKQIDALQNVKAALLDLPAYETIREDLQRLMERNNLIARVNQITDAIEQDLEDSRLQRPELKPGEWKDLDLAGMVQRFGIYYIPYRRLRIEAASDELALTVAKMLTIDEDSANYVAIRALIHAWREKTYTDQNKRKEDDQLERLVQDLARITTNQATSKQVDALEKQLRSWLQLNCPGGYGKSAAEQNVDQKESAPSGNVKTANEFLVDYDYKYWFRRLTFIRSKVDQLLQLQKIRFDNSKFGPTKKQQVILDRLNRLNKGLGEGEYEKLSDTEKSEITDFLNACRAKIIELHKELRAAGRNILPPSLTPEGSHERAFAQKLLELKSKLTPPVLNYLLGTADESGKDNPFSKLKIEDCAKRAIDLLGEGDGDSKVAKQLKVEPLWNDLKDAAEELCKALKVVLDRMWDECELLLNPQKVAGPKPHLEGVRKYLWDYLRKFDDYDQVRFPIMYGTDSGESDVVEVFRISPEDAPSLIDERAEIKKPNGRLKLAGTSLHHFGAFLDRVWRQNDIMWGRLDGAERLITMLMPYPTDALVRKALIKEAHAAILREELSTESRSQLSTLMSEALIRASTGEPIETAVEKVMKELADASPVKTRLASAITAIFDDDVTKKDDDKLVTFVRLGYQVNRRLDPKGVLDIISRSTQTIGGIFEDLANKNGLDGRSLAWIARLGQFFWGLVQVAVPNSILNKLATHWLYLLYAFEAVMIVGGVLLSRPGAQQFGWTAFGITALINMLVLVLKDEMRGSSGLKRVLRVLVYLLAGTLVLIGFLKVIGVLGFNVGEANNKLPPLAWLSSMFWTAMAVTGRFAPYLPFAFGVLFIVLVLVILNRAGKLDFVRPSRKKESFKGIKLRKFKKRDMKDIYLRDDLGTETYSVTARLSAPPPLDWIQTFEEKWKQANFQPQVRIYQDQIRFESDSQRLAGIWRQLQMTIDSTNEAQLQAVKNRNQDLETRQQQEKQRLKQELDAKWNTFKELW